MEEILRMEMIHALLPKVRDGKEIVNSVSFFSLSGYFGF